MEVVMVSCRTRCYMETRSITGLLALALSHAVARGRDVGHLTFFFLKPVEASVGRRFLWVDRLSVVIGIGEADVKHHVWRWAELIISVS